MGNRRRGDTVIVYQRTAYELLASWECYMYRFRLQPILDLQPLRLMDGSDLRPGDCLTRMRGKRSGAGYQDLRLISGHLIFQGLHVDLDGRACLFRYSEDTTEPDLFYGGYAHQDDLGGLYLIYSTPAVASRVIETTLVDRVGGATSIGAESRNLRQPTAWLAGPVVP